MKKFHNIIPLDSLIRFFRRARPENTDRNIIWRTILGFTIVSAAAIGIFAYLTYDAVTTDPLLPPSPKNRQASVSIEELRGVIAVYQKKDDDYRSLRQSPPEAPALGFGSGVSNTQ